MFIQVVQGKVKDPELLQRQMDAWRRDLKPGASGYLGSTGGVTPDGRFVVLARFESKEAAEANSRRPEQGAWWEETAQGFDGEATFHDCDEVDVVLGGGSDDAGFVQVIQGRARDKEALRRRGAQLSEELQGQRPDLLGMVVAWHADGDGAFTQAVYFRSEADARAGEAEMDDSARQEIASMLDGTPEFFDLTEPELD